MTETPAQNISANAEPLAPLRYGVEMLRNGMSDAPDKFTATMRAILAKHGKGAVRVRDLKPDACPAVLAAVREALPLHLAAIAPVFPVPRNKKAAKLANWQNIATQDAATIRKMAAANPGCNWGLVWNVIDVDTKDPKPGKKRGTDTWAEHIAAHGEPATRKALTPSGGLHYFIADQLDNTASGTLGDGIDTRGAGKGYVVAPGSYVEADGKSIHSTGFYTWANDKPVASVPWVAAKFAEAKPAAKIDAATAPGYPTEPLFDAASGKAMLDLLDAKDYQDQQAWLDLAMSYHYATAGQGLAEFIEWSDTDAEYTGKVEDRETRWNSFYRADKVKDAHLFFEKVIDAGGGKLVAKFKNDFAGEPFEAMPPDPEAEAAAAERKNRWRGLPLSAMMARPDTVWIVPGMIPEGLTFLYAKPGRGKTFFALDLSLSIAAVVDFHGQAIGKTGRVLYVAAEGKGKDTAKRVMRMIEQRKLTPEQAKRAEDNLRIVEWGVPLNDPASVKLFIDANPGDWAFVVFDTLARNMRGDENTAKDTGAVIEGVDHVRRIMKADAMVLHHEGRAVGHLRGSSALEGAPDAILQGSRDATGLMQIKAEKLREDIEGKLLHFRLIDGVLVAQTAGNVLREREDKMMTLLVALHAATDTPVPLTAWRKAVTDLGGILEGTPTVQRQQWHRAVENMASTGTIKLTGKVQGRVDKRAAIPVANATAICDDFDGAETVSPDNFVDDDIS